MRSRLRNQTHFWQTLKVTLLILFVFAFLGPPASCSPGTYTFSSHFKLNVLENVVTQLQLEFEVETSSPSQLVSRQSQDMKINVKRGLAVATTEMPDVGALVGEESFLSPLGDTGRIFIFTFAAYISYYFQFTAASLNATITTIGNGTVSPSSLLWNAAGTKYVRVSHTGHEFSQENLTVKVAFKFKALLTIWLSTYQGLFFERNSTILQSSVKTLSEEIQIVQPSGIDISLVGLIIMSSFVLIGIPIGYIVYLKKKQKLTQSRG